MTRLSNSLSPIGMSLLIIVASALYGCTRTIYEPIEIAKARTDSVSVKAELTEAQISSLVSVLQRSVRIRDSVVIRDSIVVVTNEAGNVISKETFHNSDRNSMRDETISQLRARYDSAFNAQREEISALVEQLQQTPVPVERRLTKWEKAKQEVGGVAIGMIASVIAVAVIWLITKVKR